MSAGKPIIVERLAALLLLAVLSPAFLFTCLLIGATAGGPVIIGDPLAAPAFVKKHRFRTTGPGTPTFKAIGNCSEKPGSIIFLHSGALFVAMST